MNWIVRLTARALESGDREIVLGDLAECSSSRTGALFDVLDLVVRRQPLIWTSWRRWFALIAIVGISGFYLNGMLTALSVWNFRAGDGMAALRCPLQHGRDQLSRRRNPDELPCGCDLLVDGR
jgi:hypothetical protein